MKTDLNKRLLTPNELAEYFRISLSSVYRLVDKRVLPFYKVNNSLRFDINEINEYLKSNRIESVK